MGDFDGLMVRKITHSEEHHVHGAARVVSMVLPPEVYGPGGSARPHKAL
jgi:hypothetical protein